MTQEADDPDGRGPDIDSCETDPGKIVVTILTKMVVKKIKFKNPNAHWIKSSRSNSSGYRNVSYEASSGKWRLKVSKCAQMLR